MQINEIKEVGYYCQVGDTERSNIYEVIKNTDKEWLKEDPKATLLIDTWIYEYKDENDRSVYFADGNLLSVYLDTSIIDVVKIENINYKVFGEYGQYLIEDKPTYKEQLRTAQARVKELEEKLNAQFTEMEEKLTAEENKNFELKENIKTIFTSLIIANHVDVGAIQDTIWVNTYTTLWDYIRIVLNMNDEQFEEFEKQALQKMEEVK